MVILIAELLQGPWCPELYKTQEIHPNYPASSLVWETSKTQNKFLEVNQSQLTILEVTNICIVEKQLNPCSSDQSLEFGGPVYQILELKYPEGVGPLNKL